MASAEEVGRETFISKAKSCLLLLHQLCVFAGRKSHFLDQWTRSDDAADLSIVRPSDCGIFLVLLLLIYIFVWPWELPQLVLLLLEHFEPFSS